MAALVHSVIGAFVSWIETYQASQRIEDRNLHDGFDSFLPATSPRKPEQRVEEEREESLTKFDENIAKSLNEINALEKTFKDIER